MKALLMAAGVGSRISRHLHGQPKCCVEVGENPLIKYTFELLKDKGIHDIALVTGYQEKYILQSLEGFGYRRYYNPFFRVTNSIASAWMAKDFLAGSDDLIIMNADVFIEPAVIDILQEETRSPVMLSDSTRIEDADYRFSWEHSLIKKYGKQLSNDQTTGEYVGICKLNQQYIGYFRQQMIDTINAEDYTCWWEDVIYRTVDKGAEVFVKDIAGYFWAEVDYIEDYERIKKFISNKDPNIEPKD